MMKINLDRAYKQVGEFGRAQWILTFVNSVARNAGTYMYYPFAYLVLEQYFFCNFNGTADGYEQCTAKEICLQREVDPLFNDFKVDTSYQYYIKNWFLEMDLLCMSTA